MGDEFLCPACGKAVAPHRERYCNHCGEALHRPGSEQGKEARRAQETDGPVVVRTYAGRTQGDAAETFRRDAQKLAARNYFPVSQSWADGRPGIGRVLTLGVFAEAIRPAGALTVTFELRAPAGEKTCPICAEGVRALAVRCRFCGYEFPTAALDVPDSTEGR